MLKASKKLLEDREAGNKLKRFTTAAEVGDFQVIEFDKDVDFVKRAMDAELEGNLDELEEKKARINSKILKMKRQQASSTSLQTANSPTKIPGGGSVLDQLGASL